MGTKTSFVSHPHLALRDDHLELAIEEELLFHEVRHTNEHCDVWKITQDPQIPRQVIRTKDIGPSQHSKGTLSCHPLHKSMKR